MNIEDEAERLERAADSSAVDALFARRPEHRSSSLLGEAFLRRMAARRRANPWQSIDEVVDSVFVELLEDDW